MLVLRSGSSLYRDTYKMESDLVDFVLCCVKKDESLVCLERM